MRQFSFRRFAPWLALVCWLAGCSRPPAYLAPIEAQTPTEFSLWRAQIGTELSAEEWRWFDRVLQERKYDLMRRGQASGSAAIDEAARHEIHGRLLGDVLREGLEVLLNREADEFEQRTLAYQRNEERARLIRSDDTQKLRDFALHQEELQRKIAQQKETIARLRAALAHVVAKFRH